MAEKTSAYPLCWIENGQSICSVFYPLVEGSPSGSLSFVADQEVCSKGWGSAGIELKRYVSVLAAWGVL